MNRLDELLLGGRIDKKHYDTYMQFAALETGRRYLDNLLLEVCMEEPPKNINEGFAWKDGRISIVRQIKQQIEIVDNLINGVNEDDTSSGNEDGSIPVSPGDFSDSIPSPF